MTVLELIDFLDGRGLVVTDPIDVAVALLEVGVDGDAHLEVDTDDGEAGMDHLEDAFGGEQP